ncbi:MAG: hypothetical protein ACLFU6_04220 [Candidatus Hydrogenedentota bacterium]
MTFLMLGHGREMYRSPQRPVHVVPGIAAAAVPLSRRILSASATAAPSNGSYQVKTGKRSGITSGPNRDDDPDYIIRLVAKVITVSLETVRIVEALPEDFGG